MNTPFSSLRSHAIRATIHRWNKVASYAIESLPPVRARTFYALAGALTVSAAGLLATANAALMSEVPARGGTLIEGVVGLPRFINPILALSDTDRDLAQLVYSGLMRAGTMGTLEHDLAKSHTISDDGRTYTFVLRDDLLWHDGQPVSADDVVFTIEKTQDAALKSPRRGSWNEVSVKKIDDRTVEFSLKTPYAPFLENTTMGILPQHIWEGLSAEEFSFSNFNIEPIGTGPYRVQAITRTRSGIPMYYDFTPFRKFALGEPYLSRIRIKMYSNRDALIAALQSGEISAAGSVAPETAREFEEKGYSIIRTPLPRVFGIFLNQNKSSIFAEKSIRTALDSGLDRNEIIREKLSGYATPIYGPIPPGAFGHADEKRQELQNADSESAAETTIRTLEKNGWKKDTETGVMTRKTKNKTETLSFSIATSDVPELKSVAELVAAQWAKIGVRADVKVFESGDLNQNIIRPREYEALFFGEVVGRGSDVYAFWHSSQRIDPGLNIALYANIAADGFLKKAREETDPARRTEALAAFVSEVKKDAPAFFLYSPDFLYILPASVKGLSLEGASIPSERFLHIHKAYIATERIWNFFIQQPDNS